MEAAKDIARAMRDGDRIVKAAGRMGRDVSPVISLNFDDETYETFTARWVDVDSSESEAAVCV